MRDLETLCPETGSLYASLHGEPRGGGALYEDVSETPRNSEPRAAGLACAHVSAPDPLHIHYGFQFTLSVVME